MSLLMFLLQTIVVVGALALGVRFGGVAIGLWSGAGAAVLIFVFRAAPGEFPVAAILVATAVISAVAALDASGGLLYLVKVATRYLVKRPNRITFTAPVVVWLFVVLAGTANIFLALIPVIARTASKAGTRPSRALGGSAAAASVALIASPVSAATAISVGFMAKRDVGLLSILMVTIPATLIAVIVIGLVAPKLGRDLESDPEFQRRLAAHVDDAELDPASEIVVPVGARRGVITFLVGIVLVVLTGAIPALRPMMPGPKDDLIRVPLTTTLPLIMFATGAAIMLFTRTKPNKVMDAATFRAGFVAIVALTGIAFMADTYVQDNPTYLIDPLEHIAAIAPVLLAIATALIAALTSSQSATLSTIFPIALSAGVSTPVMVGVTPATGGNGLLPINGFEYVCVEMDPTGSTRIGRWILNHFAFIPTVIVTTIATALAMLWAQVVL